MSSSPQTQKHSFLGRYRHSPRAQRRALWLGLSVLVVGAAALVFAFFRNTGHPLPDVASDEPAQIATKQKTVPIDPAALQVARQFILSAVARKNLDDAYDIAGPQLRGSLTRKQWDSGDIPVIYYPSKAVPLDAFTVTYSYAREALFRVSLIPVSTEVTDYTNGFMFFIGLKKLGTGSEATWVVDYWAPDYHPPMPGGPR